MKKSLERGFGLILLVALIAIAGILTTATTLYFRSTAREVQTKIDVARAYFAAEAGIMEAIYTWHISHSDDRLRRHDQNTGTPLSGTTSYRSKQSQANFAYFDMSSVNWSDSTHQVTGASSRRLQSLKLTNIHDTALGGSIKPVSFCVLWTTSGFITPQLIDVRINNISVLSSTYYTGSGSGVTGIYASVTPAYPTSLAAGASWGGGADTYFEWSNGSGEAAQITDVRVYFDFEDRSSNRDTGTNLMYLWGPGMAQTGGSPPSQRLLTLNAQGQASQQGGTIIKAVKATVSGVPGGSTRVEITDWDFTNEGYN